jgi:Domain of unknown function (DUF4382)
MKKIAGFLLLSVIWLACSEDNQPATLQVRLTDAPGDYQEVNIDIQEVQIHANEGQQTNGWQTIEIEKGVYNLLDFTNGLDTLLGSAELPAGRVSQIRLILGSDNTLKENDQIYDLSTPSAQQSGLKLNVQTTLTEGITYTVLLDFDVARSILKTGNGKYKLKPVIRAITEATSGAIEGTVSIPQSTPAVYAIHEQDTVGTTYANDLGKFMIKGVPAGTYTLSFAPATGYVIEDVTGVVVTTGSVTKVGEVTVIE